MYVHRLANINPSALQRNDLSCAAEILLRSSLILRSIPYYIHSMPIKNEFGAKAFGLANNGILFTDTLYNAYVF